MHKIRKSILDVSSEAQTRPSKGTATDMSNWSRLRCAAGKVSESEAFEVSVCLVVIINAVIMVFESDSAAACQGVDEGCMPEVYLYLNNTLLVIYTLELILHTFVQRLTFFCFSWNILDLGIVVLGYVELLLLVNEVNPSGFSLIRMLKILRIVRIARLVKAVPELYKFVKGFAVTVRTMFWGFVMIMILLCAWAIVTVQVLNSYEGLVGSFGEEWCNVAFQTVGGTVILFFQTLVAGDSWGLCVVPIVQLHTPLFVLFSSVLVTVQLGFTNLILAVIVDASAEAREGDTTARVKELKRLREKALQEMHDLIKRLDTDNSGTITLEELHTGYDNDKKLHDKFVSLGVDRGDMDTMITAMDNDGSGDVDYEEFVAALMKAEQNETRAQSMLLHLRIENLGRLLDERFRNMEATVKNVAEEQRTSRSVELCQGNPEKLPPNLEVHQTSLQQKEEPLGDCLQQGKVSLIEEGGINDSMRVQPAYSQQGPVANGSLEDDFNIKV